MPATITRPSDNAGQRQHSNAEGKYLDNILAVRPQDIADATCDIRVSSPAGTLTALADFKACQPASAGGRHVTSARAGMQTTRREIPHHVFHLTGHAFDHGSPWSTPGPMAPTWPLRRPREAKQEPGIQSMTGHQGKSGEWLCAQTIRPRTHHRSDNMRPSQKHADTPPESNELS